MVLAVLVQLMALFQHQAMGMPWRDAFTVAAGCALVGLVAARIAGRSGS
jgi:Na+/glutamate symporter